MESSIKQSASKTYRQRINIQSHNVCCIYFYITKKVSTCKARYSLCLKQKSGTGKMKDIT